MKSFIALILLLTCANVWGSSTQTCPSVEGGYWMDFSTRDILIDTSEYRWEHTGRGCTEDNDPYSIILAVLWRKVPYKIEWRRFDKDYMIGFREDHVCIWKENTNPQEKMDFPLNGIIMPMNYKLKVTTENSIMNNP